jgi:hypothetical protein
MYYVLCMTPFAVFERTDAVCLTLLAAINFQVRFHWPLVCSTHTLSISSSRSPSSFIFINIPTWRLSGSLRRFTIREGPESYKKPTSSLGRVRAEEGRTTLSFLAICLKYDMAPPGHPGIRPVSDTYLPSRHITLTVLNAYRRMRLDGWLRPTGI